MYLWIKTYSIVSSAQHGAVTRHSDARDGDIILGNELVRALILAQVPDTNIASTVAADEFALVWMDDNIIDWYSVCIVPLYISAPSVPNFDCAILRRGYHPFPLTVKSDTSDITRMAIEGKNRVGVR